MGTDAPAWLAARRSLIRTRIGEDLLHHAGAANRIDGRSNGPHADALASSGEDIDTAIGAESGEATDVSSVVRRAQAGDGAAFATLYLLFFRRVYRYLVVRLGNVDDAQEVAQDVFERLLSRLPEYDPSRGRFRPWIFSIAHNLAVDHLRRRARASVSPAGDQAGISERAVGAVARFESDCEFRSMIAALPPRQRRVLLLRFVYELPTEEIADLVGCTCAAVRQAQHRALDSLGSNLNTAELVA